MRIPYQNYVGGITRYSLIVAVAGAIAVLVCGFFFPISPSSRFTKREYDRIKLDMHRDEVLELLGEPGNYFSEDPGIYWEPRWGGYWRGPSVRSERPLSNPDSPYCNEWNCEQGGIRVWFDSKNLVFEKKYYFPSKKVRCWSFTVLELRSAGSGY